MRTGADNHKERGGQIILRQNTQKYKAMTQLDNIINK